MLYPVDSEFGFKAIDFVGAIEKERDFDYAEGFVGDIHDAAGAVVGLRVSTAVTDTFKVRAPMGTWCAGLGANSVKCSTERYVTMEHLMTCHETIPYAFADEVTGEQGVQENPYTGEELLDCADAKLSDDLTIVVDGVVTDISVDDDGDGVPDLIANESTVLNDVAVGRSYGLTVKDDGKVLYRFGNLIKRPNDVRLYARLPLPAEWKAPAANFVVSRAELHVQHLITNNPNDQLRPEDMENEAATGRLPAYTEQSDGSWISNRDCYEGDGDFIPAGTYLKNPAFALDGLDPTQAPPYSVDLQEGFTNAWYTTTHRDPFEADAVTGSGPRWRLKSNKFGQDIPGLEIPLMECSEVPYTKANIKYVVGDATTTVINLLDWEAGFESPLAWSQGWTEPNGVSEVVAMVGDRAITVNGLPLSDDFDLAVYIKGDTKPTSVFNARLVIEYEGDGGGDPPTTTEFDLSLDALKAPRRVASDSDRNVKVEFSNEGPEIASDVLITVVGEDNNGAPVAEFALVYGDLAPNASAQVKFLWEAPAFDPTASTVTWLATVDAFGDTDPGNDSLGAVSTIK